jgi:DeoR/GlpR family transcriptional regulator of sugar metabolism
MLAIERRRAILERLAADGRVLVADIAAAFEVAEETIRRDLTRMEREGLLSRTHGGALSQPAGPEDLPWQVRNVTNIAAKRAIGALAAGLVTDGASLMLDSSSTAFEALRALHRHRELTVITNSVRLLSEPGAGAHTVISVGGELRRRTMTFVGPVACQAAAQFNADFAFVSCKALSPGGGIMDPSVAEAAVKRALIGNAAHVVLLVDASKFDCPALVTIAGLDAIGTLVTDRAPSEAWQERLATARVTLLHG